MTIIGSLFLIALFYFCYRLVSGLSDKQTGGKLLYLEGLRGVAALIVVIFHFLRCFFPASINGNPSTAHLPFETLIALSPFYLIYSGTFYVAIFFILSGFVLSYNFFSTHSVKNVISSASRRYTRLALPVLVTSSIYYLMLQTGAFQADYYQHLAQVTHSDNFHNRYNFEFGFWDMLEHSIFSVFFEFNQAKYNNVLWTMPYEFYGSMIIFSFLLVFGKSKFRLVGYTALLLFLFVVIKKPEFIAFVFGMILSDLHVNGRLEKLKTHFSKYILLILGCYLAGFNDYLEPRFLQSSSHAWMLSSLNFFKTLYVPGRLLIIIGASIILLSILSSKRLQSLFSNRFCVFLGKISFTLYLSHYVVLFSVSCLAFDWLRASFSYSSASLISFIISMPLFFIIAWFLYLWVDRASVVLGGKLYKKHMEKPLDQGQQWIKEKILTLTILKQPIKEIIKQVN